MVDSGPGRARTSVAGNGGAAAATKVGGRGRKPVTAAKDAKVSETVRLDAPHWIQAGLEMLSEVGVEGLRVDGLAKRLGVTKGAFYHHFKDRDALLEALLTDWRRRATLDVIARLERGASDPAERLRRLLRLPLEGRSSAWGANVELVVRLWGRSDPRAQAALEEVDQVRLRYLTGLLQQLGVEPLEASRRAVLAYCYMRVSASLIDRDDRQTIDACEAILTGR